MVINCRHDASVMSWIPQALRLPWRYARVWRMLLSESLREAVVDRCTADEIHSCVAYVTSVPFSSGTTLRFPGTTLEFPWDGFLAFVDLDPMANWGHACRYVLINPNTGEAKSIAAQFPPFGPERNREPKYHWRLLYQAPGVPDAVLAVPKT